MNGIIQAGKATVRFGNTVLTVEGWQVSILSEATLALPLKLKVPRSIEFQVPLEGVTPRLFEVMLGVDGGGLISYACERLGLTEVDIRRTPNIWRAGSGYVLWNRRRIPIVWSDFFAWWRQRR